MQREHTVLVEAVLLAADRPRQVAIWSVTALLRNEQSIRHSFGF